MVEVRIVIHSRGKEEQTVKKIRGISENILESVSC